MRGEGHSTRGRGKDDVVPRTAGRRRARPDADDRDEGEDDCQGRGDVVLHVVRIANRQGSDSEEHRRAEAHAPVEQPRPE